MVLFYTWMHEPWFIVAVATRRLHMWQKYRCNLASCSCSHGIERFRLVMRCQHHSPEIQIAKEDLRKCCFISFEWCKKIDFKEETRLDKLGLFQAAHLHDLLVQSTLFSLNRYIIPVAVSDRWKYAVITRTRQMCSVADVVWHQWHTSLKSLPY